MAWLPFPDLLVAAACFGPDDLRLDQYVVGAADHDQMFDIVAADDDELPLAIEIEGINNTKPHLSGPSPRHAEPAPESEPEDEQNEHGGNEKRHRCRGDHQRFVLDKQFTQGQHRPLV